jgi:hypothetical protein
MFLMQKAKKAKKKLLMSANKYDRKKINNIER